MYAIRSYYEGVTGKLREAVKPQGALKPRIQTAVNKLQVQISKMDRITSYNVCYTKLLR